MSLSSDRMDINIVITPEILSAKYRVINAAQTDPDELYALYCSDKQYFSYFSVDLSRERLKRDMTMLPDGCSESQKHFFVYYRDKIPISLIDLIEGYPDSKTCYIGLFIVHAEYSNRGIGTDIITELCDVLKRTGFESLRLAYGKHYEKAKHFWTKNGFVPVKEAVLDDYGELIVAQRIL